MAYKLIAIDIDDTLLDQNMQIPLNVSAAIHKAVLKGVYVILCTGRTKKGAMRFYKKLDLDTLFILSGGAEVCDSEGQIVFSHPVAPDTVNKLLKYAHDNHIHAQVYIDGELVYMESNKYAKAYEASFGHPGIAMGDLLSKTIETPKVLFVTDEERIPQIQREVGPLFPDLNIMRSKPTYLEFASANVSKGEALAFTANYYCIAREQIIAVGDSQIDIPMIKYAGLGVAMANASSDVKKASDLVCASNDEGGVADVINEFILETDDENQSEN